MNASSLRIVPLSILLSLAAACGGESSSDENKVVPQDAAAEAEPEASTPEAAAEAAAQDAEVPEASTEASTDAAPEAAPNCIADFTSEISPVIDGLLYLSESDYPFEIVSYPDTGTGEITAEHMLELLKLPADTTVETRTLDEFFTDYLLTGPDGAKYTQMRQVLEKQMTNLTVIRVGEIQVHVLLVGRTKCNEIAGLTTTSIET